MPPSHTCIHPHALNTYPMKHAHTCTYSHLSYAPHMCIYPTYRHHTKVMHIPLKCLPTQMGSHACLHKLMYTAHLHTCNTSTYMPPHTVLTHLHTYIHSHVHTMHLPVDMHRPYAPHMCTPLTFIQCTDVHGQSQAYAQARAHMYKHTHAHGGMHTHVPWPRACPALSCLRLAPHRIHHLLFWGCLIWAHSCVLMLQTHLLITLPPWGDKNMLWARVTSPHNRDRVTVGARPAASTQTDWGHSPTQTKDMKRKHTASATSNPQREK